MAVKKTSPQAPEVLSMEISKISDEALLAALLRGATGKRSAMDVARHLLSEVNGDLLRLSEIASTHGIDDYGEDAHARIIAAGELTRRALHRGAVRQKDPIRSSADVLAYTASLALGAEESLVAIYVDRRLVPIGVRTLTRGSSEFTVVDPKQIYKVALQLGANALFLVHNHPSGNPEPSSQDVDVTRRVKSAGRVLGLDLLDHVVITPGRYVSLRERGIIE
jgi:DNA repair protein RadC